MRILLNKIGSVTRNLRLHREVTVTPAVAAQEGAVVAGRVLTDKTAYNQLEDVHGRMPTLQAGDVVAGALGHRNALQGYEGAVPASVAAGDHLHLLNLGGVIGRCSSYSPAVGPPFEVEILGQVLVFRRFQSREGEPAFVAMGAIEGGRPTEGGEPGDEKPDTPLPPVVYVAGTCMNSGKTAAACALIRRFARAGYRVGGAKLTGVSLLRDILGMRDYGAEVAYDFTDAGVVATDERNAPGLTRTIFSELAADRVDVIVAEMGDGILGEYGVQAILADAELAGLATAFVLCANDPVGTAGGVEQLARDYGIRPDVIAGPATDNRVGTRYVERAFGIPAFNARSAPDALGDHVIGLLRTRSGLALPAGGADAGETPAGTGAGE